MRIPFPLTRELPYRFRGKYRKIPQPLTEDFWELRREFERDERNMLILRHPYLTVEQSHHHMKDYPQEGVLTLLQKSWIHRNNKFEKTVTFAHHFDKLRQQESWD